jgi:CRISPR-associated endoribonuclease Cas6
MLARLDMRLKCTEELSYQMSSLFHGAIMELISQEYAGYLHNSQLHPFTQHLEKREKEWHWIVCCMDETAVQYMMNETLLKLEVLEIKKRGLQISIVEKDYRIMRQKELLERFYERRSGRYTEIHFVTPTAFRQRGRYLFYPDIRCIFQSLMNKYDAVVKEECMIDEEALEQLCENTEIVRYDLKSVYFYMEGVKIPSFIGKITIKMTGTQTMTDFADLLLRFGTYSGVGIKASLGMGAYRIIS